MTKVNQSRDSGTTQRSLTKQRLVETARELFYQNGYEATGIKQILAKAGVNSGSLYYFFPTKEDLLLAVLERYKELLWPMVLDPVFDRTGDPIEQVFGVLEGYRKMLLATYCRQGCPIGNLALEMSEKSDAVRKAVAENFEGWRVAIRQCLMDAGDRLPADVDRDRLATLILTTMEGGVMQARAHRNLEPYEASVAMLRDYVDRLLLHKSGGVSECAG
ncbi:MAG: TetR/AcrR family transcriptional regulator [Phycisphaerales bacterium]|nr:MAG: TetR/AcrR family transcriptional regulator [Phycisphaerales bacterium]